MPLSLVVCCIANVARAEDEPNVAAKETVQFDDQTLVLAFSGDDPGATIKEFVPAGEKLESWTRLAAIREFDNLDSPLDYGAATIEQLKKQYPKSPSSIIENPDTGAVVLDFVVWPEDASFVEFNVFRIEKRAGGGLISQQYAVRAYGDAAEPFLTELPPVRERLVEEMAEPRLADLGAATSRHRNATRRAVKRQPFAEPPRIIGAVDSARISMRVFGLSAGAVLDLVAAGEARRGDCAIGCLANRREQARARRSPCSRRSARSRTSRPCRSSRNRPARPTRRESAERRHRVRRRRPAPSDGNGRAARSACSRDRAASGCSLRTKCESTSSA